MLQSLLIKNFALIKNQTINFSSGFNVLVGETGAGKSLILDALSFVLGDKSNKLNIRYGESRLFVQAVFFVNDDNIAFIDLLRDADIDFSDNQIVITRSFSIDGKVENKINDVFVTVGLIKKLAPFLMDFYAQNDSYEMMNEKNQLNVLDLFAGNKLTQLLNEYNSLYNKLLDLQSSKDKIGSNVENRERQIEFLEFQISEIEGAELTIGEDESLKNKLQKISNAEKIHANVSVANDGLSSVTSQLHAVDSAVKNVEKYDNSLSDIITRINECYLEISDISDFVNNYLYSIDFDESDMLKLDARLDHINSLKKKYGNTIEDVLEYLAKIKEDYDNLLFGEKKLLKLEKEEKDLIELLTSKANEISLVRKSVAINIEKDVVKELNMLGFKNAQFKVFFEEKPLSQNGIDNVKFVFTANSGQELKSLSKTISGGEMSRFMLALKNVFAGNFGADLLVFDEIDSGISGETGQRVAERLGLLSKKYQLICITHLAQVAAMADNYIKVYKEDVGGETVTFAKELSENEVVSQIALISGDEGTDVGLTFAKGLKERAEKYKLKNNE